MFFTLVNELCSWFGRDDDECDDKQNVNVIRGDISQAHLSILAIRHLWVHNAHLANCE